MPKLTKDEIERRRIDNFHGLIDSFMRSCNNLSERLIDVRNYPTALDIFSAENIVEINKRQRGIPEITKKLQELKGQISFENYTVLESGEAQEKLEEIEEMIKEASAFVDLRESEIPDFRPDLLYWVFAPHKSVFHYWNKFTHKIIMMWLEMKSERLMRKKDELRKKNDEIKKEIERLKKKKKESSNK